jgi:hypothetical protein
MSMNVFVTFTVKEQKPLEVWYILITIKDGAEKQQDFDNLNQSNCLYASSVHWYS